MKILSGALAAALALGLQAMWWVQNNGWAFHGRGYNYQNYYRDTDAAHWLAASAANPVTVIRFLIFWGILAGLLRAFVRHRARGQKNEAAPRNSRSGFGETDVPVEPDGF